MRVEGCGHNGFPFRNKTARFLKYRTAGKRGKAGCTR